MIDGDFNYMHAYGWSENFHHIDLFALNDVLYNLIFVLQRYTNKYRVYRCLIGRVRISAVR